MTKTLDSVSYKRLLLSSLGLLALFQSSARNGSCLAAPAVPTASDESTPSVPVTTLREYLMPNNDRKNGNRNNDSESGKVSGDFDVYLAMGPAFFGFFGYFGALAGMEDALFGGGDHHDDDDPGEAERGNTRGSKLVERKVFRGVAGASAGAMAAILLAAGISPHRASDFVSTLGLADFADPGGLGGFLKGDRFESIMADFLRSASPILSSGSLGGADSSANANATTASRPLAQLHLEQSLVPVAVSAVDILPTETTGGRSRWTAPWSFLAETYLPTAKILSRGSMARAARASACFPGLFQPVGWLERSPGGGNTTTTDDNKDGSSAETNHYSLLIDGGIFDWAGFNGLRDILQTNNNNNDNDNNDNNDNNDDESHRPAANTKIRVLNMVVGGFVSAPPGPGEISESLGIDEADLDSVLSLSIHGLPRCGPLAMANGPLAVRAARTALREAMDRPIAAVATGADGEGTGKESRGQRQRQRGRSKSQSQSQSRHYVLQIDASSVLDEEVRLG